MSSSWLIRRSRWWSIVGVVLLSASDSTFAAPPVNRKPTLLDDARAQIELAYRLHPTETQARLEQLKAVLAAWHAAPQTDTNQEKLDNWLRAAIRASMPGSREPLPAAPNFAAPVVVAPPGQPKRVATPSPVAKPASRELKPAKPVTVAKPVETAPLQSESTPERSLIVKPTPTLEPGPGAKSPLPKINDSDFEPFTNKASDSDPFQDDPADKPEHESK